MAKKKSKEELEAEAKAEEERLAAEAKAEEERRAAAAAEAARKEAERIRLRNEEIDRITMEMNDINKLRNQRTEQTRQQLSDTAVNQAWNRYLQYNQTIDITDERSIHTFITLLTDILHTDHNGTAENDSILPPSTVATTSNSGTAPLKRATSAVSLNTTGVTMIGVTNEPPLSPLTPGLVLCSRLASVIQALEHRIADNLENNNSTTSETTTNETITRVLSTLKRLAIQRMDGLTQQLLDISQDYGIDVKDGLREISISDSFRIRSTAEELPRKGLDVAARHQHYNQIDELGGEVLLWANLPPGKIMRTKQISNGIMASSSNNNRLGITVEMHKAIASGNTALRALWTAYDDASEIDSLQNEFDQAMDAEAEGIVSRDPSERRKPTGKGRPKSSASGKSSRPASAVIDGEETKGEESTEGPSTSTEETTDATATESKEGEVPTETTQPTAEGETTTTESKTEESTESKTENTEENQVSSLTEETKVNDTPTVTKTIESDTKLTSPTVYPIGGTIHIELLAMPPTMGLVKGWAMSKPNPAAGPIYGKVRRLPHPALHQGIASAAAQAVKVRVQVPSTVIVPTDVAVAHWQSIDDDEEDDKSGNNDSTSRGYWTTKDVADVSFDPATRYLTFSTVFMKSHALCRPPHIDLPYSSWRLVPVHSNVSSPEYKINYILETLRFPITITVTANGCTLTGPTNIPELSDLIQHAQPMRPGRFLTELKRRGIDLLPSNNSIPFINAPRIKNKKTLPGINLRPKVTALEYASYINIAEIASAFEISVSEWNMHTSISTTDIVVRARERIRSTAVNAGSSSTPSVSSPPAWMNDPTVWRMVRFTADNEVPGGIRVLLVADKENEARGKDVLVPPPPPPPAPVPGPDGTVPVVEPPPEIDLTPKYEHVTVSFVGELEPGATSHSTAKLAIDPRTSPTARKEIETTSPLLSTMLERLLRLTRPLSFTYIDLTETVKQ